MGCIIVLERRLQIRTESVIAMGHKLSVEVSSKEQDRNRRNCLCLGSLCRALTI